MRACNNLVGLLYVLRRACVRTAFRRSCTAARRASCTHGRRPPRRTLQTANRKRGQSGVYFSRPRTHRTQRIPACLRSPRPKEEPAGNRKDVGKRRRDDAACRPSRTMRRGRRVEQTVSSGTKDMDARRTVRYRQGRGDGRAIVPVEPRRASKTAIRTIAATGRRRWRRGRRRRWQPIWTTLGSRVKERWAAGSKNRGARSKNRGARRGMQERGNEAPGAGGQSSAAHPSFIHPRAPQPAPTPAPVRSYVPPLPSCSMLDAWFILPPEMSRSLALMP